MTEQQTTLTPRQAARYVGISEAALRLWRSRGEGPRFFRAGEKLIRYRKSDLDNWIEARLSAPTVCPLHSFFPRFLPPAGSRQFEVELVALRAIILRLLMLMVTKIAVGMLPIVRRVMRISWLHSGG